MSILVDGYNYIGHSGELALSDPRAADKLIYLMGQYCGRARKTLTLVFDGNYVIDQANRKRRYGRVTVIYTSPIYTADDLIKKMVRTQPAKRRKALLVVSSDQEIVQYAQDHGAPVARVQEFERTLQQTFADQPELDRVNVRISDEEVQEWLKIFGAEHPDPGHSKSGNQISRSESRMPKSIRPTTAKPVSKKQATSSRKQDLHAPHRSAPRRRKPSKRVRADNDETPKNIDRVNVHLSAQEVQEWLKIFGEDPEEQQGDL
jgi:predicted RNA-binding protein with PIN domain